MHNITILPLACLAMLLGSCAPTNAGGANAKDSLPDMQFSDVNSLTDTDGWNLVWSDEFDGSEIDQTKWGFDIDCLGRRQ